MKSMDALLEECRDRMSKVDFNQQDEQDLLELVRDWVSDLSPTDRKIKLRYLRDQIEEELMIRKYKMIYQQIVHDKKRLFDSRGFLERINQTLRATV